MEINEQTTQTEQTKKQFPSIGQSWGIFGYIILSMLVFTPVLFLGKLIGESAAMLIYYLVCMGVPFYFFNKSRTKSSGNTSYNIKPIAIPILLLTIIGIFALEFGIIDPITSLIPMSDLFKEMFLKLAERNDLFSFLTVVIAAPILEELIFRGIMLDGLLKRYSPTKAILLSSFLFALVHLNPWQFIAAFITGIFAGWIYYKTRNLLLPIIIHFTNNLAAFISMSLSDPEVSMNETWTESYGGLGIALLATIGALIVAILCIYFLSLQFNKAEEVIE